MQTLDRNKNVVIPVGVALAVLIDFAARAYARGSGIGVCNCGVSFGWLSTVPVGISVVLEIVWAALLLWIGWKKLIQGPWYMYAGLYLMAAGGMGHVLSRMVWGCVWDWIDLGVWNLKGDLADGYIDFGVVCVIFGTVTAYLNTSRSSNDANKRKRKKEK